MGAAITKMRVAAVVVLCAALACHSAPTIELMTRADKWEGKTGPHPEDHHVAPGKWNEAILDGTKSKKLPVLEPAALVHAAPAHPPSIVAVETQATRNALKLPSCMDISPEDVKPGVNCLSADNDRTLPDQEAPPECFDVADAQPGVNCKNDNSSASRTGSNLPCVITVLAAVALLRM